MNSQPLVVVTGATGFIGSNLLHGLESNGYRNIVSVDYFGCGEKWRNVANRSFVYYVHPELIHEYMNAHAHHISAIVHLGGISSTTEKNVDTLVHHNIELTIRLYNFCREHNIKFIYASSAATYGNGTKGFRDCDDLEYLSQLSPLNPYGWSKNTIDKYLMYEQAIHKPNNQVVGLKFFNVYGPNEYHKQDQASVVYKFYKEILVTNNVNLFKSYKEDCLDGMQQRDFVFVQDCVDVILWMLNHPDVNGLFNVGTGLAHSFKEVADLVIKYSERVASVTFIDMPEQLKEQYQYFTQADIQKLRDVGYQKPMTSLEDGVRTYINEYLKTRNTFRYEPNYI